MDIKVISMAMEYQCSEYLEGTHPLNNVHGDPIRLFLHNLKAFRLHVTLIVFALSQDSMDSATCYTACPPAHPRNRPLNAIHKQIEG